MSVGRALRTALPLRASQWIDRAIRPLHRVVAKGLLHLPPPRDARARPMPPGLETYLRAEARREARRLDQLDPGSDLARYERSYIRGAALSAMEGERVVVEEEPLDAYPCAVAARSLAQALRLGRSEVTPLLARCAWRTLAQLEVHLAGNHLLEDAIGLGCAAAVTTGAGARAWSAAASAVLAAELDAQFLGDGGHCERSASYHAWLLGALLELFELAPERRGQLSGVIARAADWAAAVRAPDGTYPLFNDASLDAAPSIDAVLDLARALGFSPREPDPELRRLDDTGWISMSRGRFTVALDAGDVGPEHAAGHAHADSLTIEAWIDGERAIVDPGVVTYAAGASRSWCRSTASHSTVEIDGQDSSEVWASFRVGRKARAKILEVERSRDRLAVVAEHDGYRGLDGAPVHRRRVELTSDRLMVEDHISGGGTHAIASRLRLAVDAPVVVQAGETIEESSSSWYPTIGVRRDARVLTRRAEGRLPLRLSWALTPR